MDIEKIKETLLKKKAEILENLSANTGGDLNEKSGVEDDADVGSSEMSRETLYKLSQAEKETLFLIDIALRKIENGTYGICEECGSQIGEKRLEAIPWVRLCIDCSQNEEIIKSFSNKSDDIGFYNFIPGTLEDDDTGKMSE
ncbi:MAG: TraR/DksA family transcriptional regulator [Aquificae bacterium]|nr:TraR/DksA family transcriptional regulator [Aquificota bacterium]